MKVIKTIKIKIDEEEDLLNARSLVREYCDTISMPQVKKVKLLTAASEIIRNILKYVGKGMCKVSILEGRGLGVEVKCTDRGNGITDIEQAMKKGYSTSGSLGLGLSGSKNLVDDFELHSKPNEGTMVRMITWTQT